MNSNITEIYLIRHAEQLKIFNSEFLNNLSANEAQIQNEKITLSINGEKQAESLSKVPELSNLDLLFSSSYSRAIATAKYIAYINNIDINIDGRLNERKLGDLNELKSLGKSKNLSFTKEQLLNENLKTKYGESHIEVKKRMQNFLADILNNYINKKIALISHGAAIKFFLSSWCKLEENCNLIYNDNILLINSPSVIKLCFSGNKLINIVQII